MNEDRRTYLDRMEDYEDELIELNRQVREAEERGEEISFKARRVA